MFVPFSFAKSVNFGCETMDLKSLNLTSMDIKPFTQPCVCFDPTPQQLSCDLHGFQDIYRHRDQIPESTEVMLACVALYTEPDTQKAVGKSRLQRKLGTHKKYLYD